MKSALDAIQVFANSPHSVRVFETLTDGPTTGRTLAEQTGASRSTVARILDEGESRGWIDSEGSQYELTAVGEIMIEEFDAYRETIEGVQYLGEAIEWLPPPARSLDLRHFRGADIVRPSDTNPVEPFDHLEDRIRTADTMRSITRLAMRRFVKLIHEQSVEGELDSESVIRASWFETLAAEPELVSVWHERAARNGVWVYDGTVPLSLHIIDDAVALWLTDERGGEWVVRGLVVTETPAVVAWAESLYEDYRAKADPLDKATLPEA